jgi:hypothetical protein
MSARGHHCIRVAGGVHMTVLSSQVPCFLIPVALQANQVAAADVNGSWVENVYHLSKCMVLSQFVRAMVLGVAPESQIGQMVEASVGGQKFVYQTL